MSITKYIYMILVLFTFSRCTPTNQALIQPVIKPTDLLISSEDMPAGWKSFKVFSDEYDDLCYTDCAMIQFSPNEENKVYSEQSIYVYNTPEEAEENYKEELSMFLSGTAPSDWNFYSTIANQSDIYCHTHESKSYPSCIWIAQYGMYLVEFYAAILPNHISLNDFKEVLHRIDAKMKVVADKGQ